MKFTPVLVALCATALTCPLLAQGPAQPVTWSVALDPAAGARSQGERVTALVTAKIDEGWHVYATDELADGPRPLRIDAVAGGPVVSAGALRCPEPERDFDQAFAQVTAFYKDTTTCRVPLTVKAHATPGAAAIDLDISFQACDGRMCLPGRTVRVSAAVTVAAKAR
jgi:DsbC/DsbD-like thiol-disulfide interchange protein